MSHPVCSAPESLLARILAAAVIIFILIIAGPSSIWAQSTEDEKILVLQRGAASVSVVRGQEAAAPPSGVTVVRGPAILRQAASSDADDYRVEKRHKLRAVAGDSIWLLDRTSGELISCYLIDGPDYGEAEIRCWKRDLPYE